MIIWVDCDEVLCSTLVELVKLPEFCWVDWKSFYSYSPPKAPGFSMSDDDQFLMYKKLLTSDNFWNIKPVKWAFEMIKKIKDAWHELVVVTWRASFIAERTKKWIEKYYPNLFSDFLFAETHTDNQKTKAELCEEKGIEFFIEDDPYFASNLSEKGIPCALLAYPWNDSFDLKKHSNVHRIKSWDEFDMSLLS
jgi:uncharacterized HAD superfamily protein